MPFLIPDMTIVADVDSTNISCTPCWHYLLQIWPPAMYKPQTAHS
jgi:hypothetical protein